MSVEVVALVMCCDCICAVMATEKRHFLMESVAETHKHGILLFFLDNDITKTRLSASSVPAVANACNASGFVFVSRAEPTMLLTVL